MVRKNQARLMMLKLLINLSSILFFLIILFPLNMLLKLFHYDPLKLKFPTKENTLFVKIKHNTTKKHDTVGKNNSDHLAKENDSPDNIYPMW